MISDVLVCSSFSNFLLPEGNISTFSLIACFDALAKSHTFSARASFAR